MLVLKYCCRNSHLFDGNHSALNQMQTISCKLVFPDFRRLNTLFIMSPRILRVPFTGSVKLRALLLKTGPTDQTPSKVVLVRPMLLGTFCLVWAIFKYFILMCVPVCKRGQPRFRRRRR
jgi:hypothetical protein